MYDYLIGVLLLGLIWCVPFFLRKDLRRPMIWGGVYYTVFLSIGFICYRLAVHNVSRMITPGYWEPHTLFNLGAKTGGWAIEDALFMFFVAGISAASYEFVFKKQLGEASKGSVKRFALLIGAICATILMYVTSLNAMYAIIGFNFFAAVVLLIQRPDLLKQSLWGGLLFLVVYAVDFLVFNAIFPSFMHSSYHLQHTSGVFFLGLPLEEYLYGFTFGLIWAPFYRYKFGIKAA